MKKVLAELHELINELEDNGLTAEASSLQEVFVRVAQEADTKDDLANAVENVLEKHSAPKVIAELAKQMAGGDDTKTMSFAYEGPEFTESERTLGTENNPLYEDTYGPYRMHGGARVSPLRGAIPHERQPRPAPYKEPKYVIMNEFIGQAIKGDMRPDDAYFMMNQRLESNGYTTISKPEFDTYVKNKSEINPNLTVRQDLVPPRAGIVNRGPYTWYVKDKRDVDPNYDPIE